MKHETFICVVTGLVLALVSSAPSFGQSTDTGPLSLEEAMAARAANGLVFGTKVSTKGGFVAWLEGNALRVATAPEFDAKTLLRVGEDRSVEAIYLSPDGGTIFYIADQRKNCLREKIQPARMDEHASSAYTSADAECIESDSPSLWSVDVASGQETRIAFGNDVPKGDVATSFFGARAAPSLSFSPNGDAFAYAEAGVLYEFRRGPSSKWARRRATKPDLKHMAATDIASITYSPDGKKIAFISLRRAGQAFMGIYDVASEETFYVEPSIFRDVAPVWSPDSSELAFVRIPGNWPMTYRFTPSREGVPWHLVAANPETGDLRTIFKADEGAGSVFEPYSPGFNPIWTPKGDIIFGWEKTGWNLAYAVPAEGGEARLLTPGEGEVTNPALSPDGSTLVFEWNKDDLGRKHLWQLNLDGANDPVAITSGAGVEVDPGFIGEDTLIYLAVYQVDKPAALIVKDAEGASRPIHLRDTEDRQTVEAIWEKFEPTEVEYVQAKDGVTSSHILIKPKTPPPPSGYPVVVQAHGGPTYQTLPGFGRFFLGQYLASRGYLFVNMNYRGGLGFGLEYRTPEGAGANGGSETLDLAALAKHLKGREDVNPEKIGIMGTSYGGHIVGQAMSRLADDYAVAVSQVGVADWVVELKKDSEEQGWSSAPTRYIRLSERLRIEDLAHQASPSSKADQWRGPVLFTLGELDRAGHVESAIDLGYRLMEQGVEVEVYIDPEGGHGTFAVDEIVDFFDRRLR
ncbi:MAG: prolyl oligopeptidase family serine peptidase [Pseudomonadota bacterium]